MPLHILHCRRAPLERAHPEVEVLGGGVHSTCQLGLELCLRADKPESDPDSSLQRFSCQSCHVPSYWDKYLYSRGSRLWSNSPQGESKDRDIWQPCFQFSRRNLDLLGRSVWATNGWIINWGQNQWAPVTLVTSPIWAKKQVSRYIWWNKLTPLFIGFIEAICQDL